MGRFNGNATHKHKHIDTVDHRERNFRQLSISFLPSIHSYVGLYSLVMLFGVAYIGLCEPDVIYLLDVLIEMRLSNVSI